MASPRSMAPPWNALRIRLRLNVAEAPVIRREAEPRNKAGAAPELFNDAANREKRILKIQACLSDRRREFFEYQINIFDPN